MEPDIMAMARRIDELSGAMAALLGVVASIPGVDRTVIQNARDVLGDMPAPVENISGPISGAHRALERIQMLADRLAKRA
jgi:hypothetical protein